MNDVPRVVAIVVAHGDDPRTPACLDALRASEGVVVSIVLVVNGATAGRDAFDAGRDVRVLRRSENPGFAGGFQDGLSLVEPGVDRVASVNPDCRVEPGALRAASDALDGDATIGAVAFRLTRPGGATLDSAGVVLRPLLWKAVDRGSESTASGAFASEDDVDAPCLAGALLRRTALEAARDGKGDVLDVRYFAYQEDVDLGWRLRRAGFRVRYVPAAAAVHERGWRKDGRRNVAVALRRASLRNRIWTLLKNAPIGGALARLPILLLYEAALATYLLLREPDVLPAYIDAWNGAAESIRRRNSPPAP